MGRGSVPLGDRPVTGGLLQLSGLPQDLEQAHATAVEPILHPCQTLEVAAQNALAAEGAWYRVEEPRLAPGIEDGHGEHAPSIAGQGMEHVDDSLDDGEHRHGVPGIRGPHSPGSRRRFGSRQIQQVGELIGLKRTSRAELIVRGDRDEVVVVRPDPEGPHVGRWHLQVRAQARPQARGLHHGSEPDDPSRLEPGLAEDGPSHGLLTTSAVPVNPRSSRPIAATTSRFR